MTRADVEAKVRARLADYVARIRSGRPAGPGDRDETLDEILELIRSARIVLVRTPPENVRSVDDLVAVALDAGIPIATVADLLQKLTQEGR